MPRFVQNPFKENRIQWVKYIAIIGGFCCVLVVCLCVGLPMVLRSLDDATISSSSSAPLLLLRKKEALQLFHDNKEGSSSSAPTVAPTVEPFPILEQDGYANWLARRYSKLEYPGPKIKTKKKTKDDNTYRFQLNRNTLQESLVLGCNNIRHNQHDEGNFHYMYDFVKQTLEAGDSPVRQAGALWGLALCFQSQPHQTEWKAAVEKGLDFFLRHSQEGPMPGSTMVVYPGFEQKSDTGANALLGLALIDYLRTIQDHNMTTTISVDKKQNYEAHLFSTIQFLKFLQLPNQSFAQHYQLDTKWKAASGSPYFDGEAMLCLCKAARYLDGYSTTLVPLIEQAAFVLAKRYTLDVWRNDVDSAQTKGFYQWSSMFLWEYWHAQWKDYEVAGDYVMVVAHWVIYIHEILLRSKNTGYAFEGLACAYDIASLRGRSPSIRDLERTIDEGLYKLGQWQVGGPLSEGNSFLNAHPIKGGEGGDDDPLAMGGIMSSKNDAALRIDTTQHQMHAVMMAMEFLYTGQSESTDT